MNPQIKIPWTRLEIFTDPVTGNPGPKDFAFERGQSFFQFSAHDPTICGILPNDFWQPAFIHPDKTLRTATIDDHAVWLVGFGTESDSAGRLMMFRLRFNRMLFMKKDPATTDHWLDAMTFINIMLRPHGFDAGKSVLAASRKN